MCALTHDYSRRAGIRYVTDLGEVPRLLPFIMRWGVGRQRVAAQLALLSAMR